MASVAKSVMLAKKWEEKIDPTGWWMSEKLDGVRAYWTGSAFYSRLGNEFKAPAFFTKDLPKTPLDGELWCGRGLFSKTLSIVKKTKDVEAHANDWKLVTYLVFDAPAMKEPYEARVKWIHSNINVQKATTYAAPVGVQKCKGKDHLNGIMKAVLMKGGEGLMLRQPGSFYEHCRSSTLLKVKMFHDEEAKVTGMENGTGRCAKMMGKLHCVLPNGVTFKVGSGFSDVQRKNPPKVGSIITFKYQELSDHGNPRFPVFLNARPDLTWQNVLDNAKAHLPFSQVKKIKVTLTKQHSILFSTIPSRDQKTGAKQITTDDEDDTADNALAAPPPPAPAAAKKSSKPMCKYGATCFRTNEVHLKAFDHPSPSAAAGSPSAASVSSASSPSAVSAASPAAASPSASDNAAPAKKEKRKKVADDDGILAAPLAKKKAKSDASPDAAAAASSPASPSDKPMCVYGDQCFRTSKHHLAQYAHPPPHLHKNVNASQVDLNDYFNFGGDDEELKEAVELEEEDEPVPGPAGHQCDWGIGGDIDDSEAATLPLDVTSPSTSPAPSPAAAASASSVKSKGAAKSKPAAATTWLSDDESDPVPAEPSVSKPAAAASASDDGEFVKVPAAEWKAMQAAVALLQAQISKKQ